MDRRMTMLALIPAAFMFAIGTVMGATMTKTWRSASRRSLTCPTLRRRTSIGYFEAIVWPIMAISMLIEKTSRGKASLNRITELLDAPLMWPTAPVCRTSKTPRAALNSAI